MPAISQKVLTQQLRELVSDGLVRRQPTGAVPAPVEYSLRAYGRSVLPLVEGVRLWGRAHMARSGTGAEERRRALTPRAASSADRPARRRCRRAEYQQTMPGRGDERHADRQKGARPPEHRRAVHGIHRSITGRYARHGPTASRYCLAMTRAICAMCPRSCATQVAGALQARTWQATGWVEPASDRAPLQLAYPDQNSCVDADGDRQAECLIAGSPASSPLHLP